MFKLPFFNSKTFDRAYEWVTGNTVSVIIMKFSYFSTIFLISLVYTKQSESI